MTRADEKPPVEKLRLPLVVFDDKHPPAKHLIDECVHCGFCLPTCPTYRLWGQEADSPRGRIYLMKLAGDGEVPLDKGFVEHFDRCLGCMACLTSCPSGVQYDKLIEATRSQIERRYPRSLAERLMRRMIFTVFPYPGRLRLLSIPLWIYQRSGLAALMRGAGFISALPNRLRSMHDLLPTVNLRNAATSSGSIANPRLRVGMLLGCVQRVFFGDVNSATARVLAAEGCEVVVPPTQGCCGALLLHAGEEERAAQFARQTIDAFEAANVDVIAINSAGCGSAMKEYGHLLRDDPQYAKRAKAFAAKCRDISEILADLKPLAKRNPLPISVAYHDACHLQHAQKITAQPRSLLQGIPQLELREIADAGICCGSAGIYNLLQPQAASELGMQKAQNVIKTKAEVFVSGNPGCSLQLRTSLVALGETMPVLHWIELLDASISGTIPPAIGSLLKNRNETDKRNF